MCYLMQTSDLVAAGSNGLQAQNLTSGLNEQYVNMGRLFFKITPDNARL